MILDSKKISFLLIAGIKNIFVNKIIEGYNKNVEPEKRIYNCKINSKELKDFLNNEIYSSGLEIKIKETVKEISSYSFNNLFTLVYGGADSFILDKFYTFLKLIKPSDIFINTVFTVNKRDDKFEVKTFGNHPNIDYRNIINTPFTSNYGFVDLSNLIVNLDKFILGKQDGALQNIINLYLEANNSEKNYVKIILYVSVLEMLNNNSGKDSITVKVSRLPAVLLGFDVPTSEMVYSNVKNIYDLRSKMVHQAKFGEANKKIADYLANLISSIFLTLLDLDKLKIENLFSAVNHFGFGQRDLIFKEYSTKENYVLYHREENYKIDLFTKNKK